jgi:drug/metabolite transporter (DMT)-like permease
MATRPASTSPSSDLTFGIALAMSSSLAIGSSFIVKKKGLKLASARGGLRAGSGGFGYLREPLWWGGMITMIVGEVANFAAYAYAPAVIVTPLGALSIIVAAVLSHHILRERLNGFGWLGCFLCVVGSLSVVMHAPEDRPIRDVRQLWEMASAPTFATYAAFATCLTSYLITSVYPRVGEKARARATSTPHDMPRHQIRFESDHVARHPRRSSNRIDRVLRRSSSSPSGSARSRGRSR